MLLGVIADDFTGASDIAGVLAAGGMSTRQFVGIPATAGPTRCDAGVVSLKIRSVPKHEAVADALRALEWLQAQGCEHFVYKYCSTFDSTIEGNIGPVAQALADALGAYGVPVCPAFPANGRTVYQGHLFVGDCLLSESGMERHPLTPMTDPDIRRWLRQQVQCDVGHIPLSKVQSGSFEIEAELKRVASNGTRLVVIDAVSDNDLRKIGAASRLSSLVTGGSGIALGLPENFAARLTGRDEGFRTVSGPAAVLAGSCAAQTGRQIEEYAKLAPTIAVEPDRVVRGQMTPADTAKQVLAQVGRPPVVYSSAGPASVAAAQARLGQARVAQAIEEFFAALALELVQQGARNIVVAGGETSGAVVEALRPSALAVGPQISPGVPVLLAEGDPEVGLVLKSGNFGGDDFFERALEALAA